MNQRETQTDTVKTCKTLESLQRLTKFRVEPGKLDLWKINATHCTTMPHLYILGFYFSETRRLTYGLNVFWNTFTFTVVMIIHQHLMSKLYRVNGQKTKCTVCVFKDLKDPVTLIAEYVLWNIFCGKYLFCGTYFVDRLCKTYSVIPHMLRNIFHVTNTNHLHVINCSVIIQTQESKDLQFQTYCLTWLIVCLALSGCPPRRGQTLSLWSQSSLIKSN